MDLAAPIDARLFERIRRMQPRFDALSARLAEGFALVSEAEGMDAIEAATATVRREMKAEADAGSSPLTRRD